MTNRLRRLGRDEAGMSYVFIGLGCMAFLSASMLAIDVGMLMTARNQAQNSADAGALAGADRAALRRLRRSLGVGTRGHLRDRRGDEQPGHERQRLGDARRRDVSARPGGRSQPGPGRGPPHGGARQSGLDPDCAVLRHGERGHRRHRHCRGLARQCDDLRQALHHPRQVERGPNGAVEQRRHLRRVRQQGPSARQPRRLHSGEPAGIHRVQPGVQPRRATRDSRRQPAATLPSASTSRWRWASRSSPAATSTARTSPTATRRSTTGAIP